MITIDLIGRLGNQMFQYALCRTIAEKRGFTYYISKDENSHGQNISKYFKLDMGINNSPITNQYTENHLVQSFDPNIFNIPDGTKIWGFFQTEKYLIENKENIKKWFQLEIGEETKYFIEKYPINNYCYIHFRGTDYKDWDNGKMFLPKKYFDDAIEYVKNIKKDIKFLIITDDIESAKIYFPDFEIISNDMMIDFKLLMISKFCVLTNSTFSWWAAWLSDKDITIAPNYWLNYNRPGVFYPKDIKTEKFIYI